MIRDSEQSNAPKGMRSIFPKGKQYIVFDWSNLVRRAYHSTTEGKVLGLLCFMLNKQRRERPGASFIVALEGKGRDIRAARFPAYKANRTPDQNFQKIERNCRKLLDFIACKQIVAPDGEADDAIACFVRRQRGTGNAIIIVSEDRDLWQLVSAQTTVLTRKYGRIDEHKCEKILQVLPKNVACLKALLGDSDNIPRGVPRMQTKRLVALARMGTSPAEAYRQAKKAGTIQETDLKKIVKYKEQISLNFELISLQDKLKLKSKVSTGEPEKLEQFLRKNGVFDLDSAEVEQLAGQGT